MIGKLYWTDGQLHLSPGDADVHRLIHKVSNSSDSCVGTFTYSEYESPAFDVVKLIYSDGNHPNEDEFRYLIRRELQGHGRIARYRKRADELWEDFDRTRSKPENAQDIMKRLEELQGIKRIDPIPNEEFVYKPGDRVVMRYNALDDQGRNTNAGTVVKVYNPYSIPSEAWMSWMYPNWEGKDDPEAFEEDKMRASETPFENHTYDVQWDYRSNPQTYELESPGLIGYHIDGKNLWPEGDVRLDLAIRDPKISEALTLDPDTIAMPDINYVLDYNPEDETGWQARIEYNDVVYKMFPGLENNPDWWLGHQSKPHIPWVEARDWLADIARRTNLRLAEEITSRLEILSENEPFEYRNVMRDGAVQTWILEKMPEGYRNSKLAATVEDSEPPENFGFMKEPHDELYPAAFENNKMRPEANEKIKKHILDVIAKEYNDPDEWIYFTVYGSGASYNWDEDGDFDVQMWIDYSKFQDNDTPVTADDLVADVRRLIQTANFPTFKEIGLDTPDCEGSMLIQYYGKAGTGSKEENLASKPYSCYDMETNEWLVKPKPLTPDFYGKNFLMVLPKAQDIAEQAESALSELERNITDWQFWTEMYKRLGTPDFKKQADDAQQKAEQQRLGVKNLFLNVFQGRQKAYSPEGAGIEDERDIVQKVLEIWGIFQKLKHYWNITLPWEEITLPSADIAEDKEHNSHAEKETKKEHIHSIAGWNFQVKGGLEQAWWHNIDDYAHVQLTNEQEWKGLQWSAKHLRSADELAEEGFPIDEVKEMLFNALISGNPSNPKAHEAAKTTVTQWVQFWNDYMPGDLTLPEDWDRTAALQGLPQDALGPHPELQQLAESYTQGANIPYNPPRTFQKVDPDRATQIAELYDQMEHKPDDPQVKASYDALIKETMNQYKHLVDNGYRFEFYPQGVDPYPSGPRAAIEDLRNNKHMYVYPTYAAFGQGDDDGLGDEDHPLLQQSGEYWHGEPVTYNDIFRAVHDAFGHAKEGVGFRANGEENAWRQHSSMYSDLARPALTAETRGQNSWVNFGPHGELNQNANQQSTIYADQKAGLLPRWVTYDGSHDAQIPTTSKMSMAFPGSGTWYHVAPRRFRESIEEHGLDYNRNFGAAGWDVPYDSYGNYLAKPQAVDAMRRLYQEPIDIWAVNTNGLTLYGDPMDNSWTRPGREDESAAYWAFSRDPISPDRLRRVNNPYQEFEAKTAKWDDIMEKAQRIRDAGGVTITRNGHEQVVGQVESGTTAGKFYDTEFWRQDPASQSITLWNCFLPEAPITMDDGTRKSIRDLVPGEYVITHEGNRKRVIAVMRQSYQGEITRLRLSGQREEVIATSNHLMWIADRHLHLERAAGATRWRKTGTTAVVKKTINWKEIGDLKKGDYVSYTPSNFCEDLVVSYEGQLGQHRDQNGRFSKGTHQQAWQVDEELAYLLGWYTAEGCPVKSSVNRVAFTLSLDELDVAHTLSRICENKFRTPGTIRIVEKRGVIDFRVSHFGLRQMVEELIPGNARTKKLDSRILNLPLEILSEFMRGWSEGDGHKELTPQGHRINLITVSKDLADQGRMILARMGFASSLTWNDENSGNGFVKHWVRIYRLRWHTNQEYHTAQRLHDGKMAWLRVDAVTQEHYEGQVYDIEVEDDHSFQAYGANVHNCTCPWNDYSWGRTRQWKKYEGRPCAHVLALYWESLGQPTDEEQEQQPQQLGLPQEYLPESLPSANPAPVPGGPNIPVETQAPVDEQSAQQFIQPAEQPRQDSHLTGPDESSGQLSLPGTFSKTAFEVRPIQKGDMYKPFDFDKVGLEPFNSYQDPAQEQSYNIYDGDNLIGSVEAWEDFGEEMYVASIWIDPEYRKTNAFMELMKPVYQAAKEKGLTFAGVALHESLNDLKFRLNEGSWRISRFTNGDYVRANFSVEGYDDDGNYETVPRNKIGEVIWSDDDTSVVIFSLESSYLGPHNVRVEAPTDNFSLVPRERGTAPRRHR